MLGGHKSTVTGRSKVAELPPKLLRAVERRLRKPEFDGYAGLAQWVRQRGYNVSVTSLKRFRNRSTKHGSRPTSSKKASRPSSSWRGTTESLMRLTEENLGSELSEIRERKEGDMSRLAHAVAHLTQA